QITDIKLRRDSSSGVGDEEIAHSQSAEHAHRESCQGGGMTLVQVESAAEGDDLASTERADDHGPLVADDGCLGKAGDVNEWNANGVANLLRQSAETGAKDDRQRRLDIGAIAYRGCRSGGRLG